MVLRCFRQLIRRAASLAKACSQDVSNVIIQAHRVSNAKLITLNTRVLVVIVINGTLIADGAMKRHVLLAI